MRRGVRTGTVAVLLGLALIGGCALTPDEKHRILTFFFDDVPPLGGEVVEQGATSSETASAAARARLSAIRAQVEFVSIHGPYAQKECGQCHDSQERYSSRLIMPEQQLCWKCHNEVDFPGKVRHPPMAAGRCGGCHDAHRSKHELLLVATEATLCERCHDEDTFPGATRHRTEQGENCISCHDPHATDRDYMLTNAGSPP